MCKGWNLHFYFKRTYSKFFYPIDSFIIITLF
nr:MAG TPA: hypothetical protein [Bacteriophage sp.]